MNLNEQEVTCYCSCGDARLDLATRPRTRFLCHCTICQSVYRDAYADATIVRRGTIRRYENVEFKRHRAPPSLSRGTCVSCGEPVVGMLAMLAFVPARIFPQEECLPEPAMHIFYHSRQADAQDELPKHSGYFASEWAVTKLALGSLLAPKGE